MQFHMLSILLFGVSSNIDNLVVGLSYGIKNVSIRWFTNFIIGTISFAGTILSMLFGKSLLLFVPEKFANIIGSLIIILIGSIGLIRSYISRKKGKNDENDVHLISVHEAVLLGVALTVNNVGLGIGASITGMLLLPTALCSLFFSLFFIFVGNWCGRSSMSNFVGKFADPFANLIMIGLGMYEIFI